MRRKKRETEENGDLVFNKGDVVESLLYILRPDRSSNGGDEKTRMLSTRSSFSFPSPKVSAVLRATSLGGLLSVAHHAFQVPT